MAPIMLSLVTLVSGAAQQPKTDPPEQQLGQQVRVLLKNGHVVEGTIQKTSAKSMVLLVKGLGTTVQKRENVARVFDATSGAQLGWKELGELPPRPERTASTETGTSTPPTPTPPTEPDVAPPKSGGAAALQQRLKEWEENGWNDVGKLREELNARQSPASAYVIQNMDQLDADVLPTAMRALVEFKDAGAAGLLQKLLTESKRAPVRVTVVAALMQLSSRPDAYLAALQDPAGEVRAAAVKGVTKFSEPAYVRYVAPLVGDPDSTVRGVASGFVAGWAKEQQAESQVAEWVADGLSQQKDAGRRTRICEFLGSVPCAEAVAALRERWAGPDLPERIQVAKSVGRIDLPEARALLRDALGSVDASADFTLLQSLALSALALKDRGSIRPLVPLLEHADKNLRAHVLRALQEISGVKLPEDREAWDAWVEKQPNLEEQP
jgi:HEAT repeat protein